MPTEEVCKDWGDDRPDLSDLSKYEQSYLEANPWGHEEIDVDFQHATRADSPLAGLEMHYLEIQHIEI